MKRKNMDQTAMTSKQVIEEYNRTHPGEAIQEGPAESEQSQSGSTQTTTEVAQNQKPLDKEAIKLAIREAIKTRKVPEDLLGQIYLYLDSSQSSQETVIQGDPLKVFNDMYSVLSDIKKLLTQIIPSQLSTSSPVAAAAPKVRKPLTLKRGILYGCAGFGVAFLIGLIVEIAMRF